MATNVTFDDKSEINEAVFQEMCETVIDKRASAFKDDIYKIIKEELDDIRVDISNNNIWLKGSSNKEEEISHVNNIRILEEYEKRIKFFRDMLDHISI